MCHLAQVSRAGFYRSLQAHQPMEEERAAGDVLTMPEVAAHLSKVTGRSTQFQGLPLEQAGAAMGHDLATMFRCFNEVGYQINVAALQQIRDSAHYVCRVE